MTRTLTATPDEPPRHPPQTIHFHTTAHARVDGLLRIRGTFPEPLTPGPLAHFYVDRDGNLHAYPGPGGAYTLRNVSLRDLRRALEAFIDTDPDPATIDQVTAHVTRLTATLTGDDPTGDDVERAARRAALSGDIADLLRGHP